MTVSFQNGAPVGGNITIYLLEKSRVLTRAEGERSFHAFYQLLAGMNANQRARLHLSGNADDYPYLANSNCTTVRGINDAAEYEEVVQVPPLTPFRLAIVKA